MAAKKKNSLVNNINKRKRAGKSRPKSRSTVSKKSYSDMKQGWPKSAAKKGGAKKKSAAKKGGAKKKSAAKKGGAKKKSAAKKGGAKKKSAAKKRRSS